MTHVSVFQFGNYRKCLLIMMAGILLEYCGLSSLFYLDSSIFKSWMTQCANHTLLLNWLCRPDPKWAAAYISNI